MFGLEYFHLIVQFSIHLCDKIVLVTFFYTFSFMHFCYRISLNWTGSNWTSSKRGLLSSARTIRREHWKLQSMLDGALRSDWLNVLRDQSWMSLEIGNLSQYRIVREVSVFFNMVSWFHFGLLHHWHLGLEAPNSTGTIAPLSPESECWTSRRTAKDVTRTTQPEISWPSVTNLKQAIYASFIKVRRILAFEINVLLYRNKRGGL